MSILSKSHRWGFWAAVSLMFAGTCLLTFALWNSPEPLPENNRSKRVSILDIFKGAEATAAGNTLDGTNAAQLLSGSAPLALRNVPEYEEEGLSLEEILVTDQGDSDLDNKFRQLTLSEPKLAEPSLEKPQQSFVAKDNEGLFDQVIEPTFDNDAVWVEHKVQKGETLSTIAEKYHIPSNVILDVNGLTNSNKLSLGQSLIIPKEVKYAADAKAELAEQKLRAQQLEAQSKPIQYENYVVKNGDSLWTIASHFDLSIDSLLGVNSLKNPEMLKVGSTLKIPNQDGILKKVAKGDTLESLAKKYDISAQAIATANNLSSTKASLKVGTQLFLPGASNLVEAYRNASNGGVLQQKSPQVAQARPEATGRFIWPLRGRINSPFGWRVHPIMKKRWFHTGIDIKGATGAPICAARSGQVTYAGWMNGYGRTVIIQHDSKHSTLYAHASKILVKKNQMVKQGQTIALVGTSGRSTGSHLHFEVRVNNKPTDPMSYLK